MPRPWKMIDVPEEYRDRERVMMQCPDCLAKHRDAYPYPPPRRLPILELTRSRLRHPFVPGEVEVYGGTCPECSTWFLG